MTLEKTLQQVQKNRFWKEKKIISLIVLSFILNLFIWLYLIFTFKGSEGLMILHFNLSSGADLIGYWTRFLVFPVLALGCLLINAILIFHYYVLRKQKIIDLLCLLLLFSQIICLAAVLLIINL